MPQGGRPPKLGGDRKNLFHQFDELIDPMIEHAVLGGRKQAELPLKTEDIPGIDQRSALALNVARQKLMHLSLAEFKALVRDQAFLLQLERERAVEALASLVPEADARKELLNQVHAIIGAGDPPLAAERDRLAHLSQVLAAPIEKAAVLVPSDPVSLAGTTARRSAVSR